MGALPLIVCQNVAKEVRAQLAGGLWQCRSGDLAVPALVLV